MPEIPSSVWFPIVTLVMGILLKWLFDVLAEGRADRRDRVKRQEQRLMDAELEQSRFQRETLLELQDAILTYGRCVGSLHFQDAVAARQSGKWGVNQLPDDINEQFLASQLALNRLSVRVRDDFVREHSNLLAETGARASMAKSEKESNETVERLTAISFGLQQRIGQLLRGADDFELTVIKR